jgi:hypothetical protein
LLMMMTREILMDDASLVMNVMTMVCKEMMWPLMVEQTHSLQ